MEHAPGGSETILVVEDEAMLLDLLASVLGDKGYRVLTARDGEEALSVLRAQNELVSLVISDYGLPKASGYELLKQLHASDPSLKFIMSSGSLSSDLRMKIIQEGASDIFLKPYRSAEVLKRVRFCLDEKPSV
jgi:DNA-binding response OmpR family regulator